MLDALIRLSLRRRFAVLALAAAALAYGGWTLRALPVDVFPDLNRPTVSIMTEAHGLAPEEVETLVTLPIEAAMNGAPGVTRVRSTSGIGLSIVFVEFDWGTETYRNRQLVSERLQLAQSRLPRDAVPALGPITSIMGEIQFLALTSPGGEVSPMALRELADWVLRPRLMSLPGLSQIIVMGGEVKQFQILVSSDRLSRKGISLEDLRHALGEISENTTGGFLDVGGKELLIRPLARVESIEQIESTPVGYHLGIPVLVKDVAEVRIGARVKRGEASVNGKPAVLLSIQKQPGASTIDLSRRVDSLVKELAKELPRGARIENDLFRQGRFIQRSMDNVGAALRDGAVIVAVVLVLFLMNLRTTAITLLTIPLSLVVTALVFRAFGMGINTMTLGGIAIAIGELVDDAIVDVENVFRRLKENRAAAHPRSVLRVVFDASSEVRNSIVLATAIVVLVFVPLFALSGIEGRLFAPLGVAYVVSLLASLVVSLTVTPALCSLLLGRARLLEERKDGALVRALKRGDRWLLERTLPRAIPVAGVSLALLGAALALVPRMGREFLPAFHEGTATVSVLAAPGISLAESNALGTRIEEAILSIPEVKSTVRRTGRAEMDEHAEGVHSSEIDVDFKEGGRAQSVVFDEIRERTLRAGRVLVNVGQPISHRLDHLLSGVRAQLAVKIFGPELGSLRRLGAEIEGVIGKTQGFVDVQLEQVAVVPQLKIEVRRDDARAHGIRPGNLAGNLEMALNGEVVSSLLEGQRIFDIFMRLDDRSRSTPEAIESILVKTTPAAGLVRLKEVADVYQGTGPNQVSRENLGRRIVVAANASGRDLGGLVERLREEVDAKVSFPPGYRVEYGGQFESERAASRKLLALGCLSLLGIFGLLFAHFRSAAISLQILLNVPLAMIGGIAGIYVTDRVFSVATLVGLITLCGIASRNGIMMISHYLHLMKEEGMAFGRELVIRGSLERLVPVLMTASSAALALLPLLLSGGEAGKEILHPVAVVIVGGLVTSTLLDCVVTPAVFLRFGRASAENWLRWQKEREETL